MFATFQQSADRNFVRSVTGMARNKPPPPYFDFMHATAFAPRAVLDYGFDTSIAPELILNSHSGWADWYTWGIASLSDRYVHADAPKWYRTRTTVSTYAGWIGTFDSTRDPNFVGDLVSYSITQIEKVYPWYENLIDRMQPHVDATAAYNGSNVPSGGQYLPSGTPATNPSYYDPSRDLSKSGLPNSVGSSTSEWRYDFLSGSGGPWFPDSFLVVNPVSPNQPSVDSSNVPMPTETSYSYTMAYGPWNAGKGFTNTNGVCLVSVSITLSDSATPADVDATANTLLALMPLSPKALVTTREGQVRFDYYGVKATDSTLTNLAAGKNYDSSGHCIISGLTPGKPYAVTLGANEDYTVIPNYFFENGVPSSFPYDVSTWLYAYYWGESDTKYDPSGSPPYPNVLFTSVDSPFWKNDVIQFGGSLTLAGNGTTVMFVPRTSSVKIIAGTASLPVTAIITEGHFNHLIAFQTTVAGGVVNVVSGYRMPFMFVAERNDTSLYYYSGISLADASLVKSQSLIRVPKNPSSVVDYTLFGYFINGFFPSVTIESEASVNGWPDYSDGENEAFFQMMSRPGEYYFPPSDAPYPGWLQFCADGKYGTANPSLSSPPSEGAGDPNAGAGN